MFQSCDVSRPVQQKPGDPERAGSKGLYSSGQWARPVLGRESLSQSSICARGKRWFSKLYQERSAGHAEISLVFIGAAVLFLPLFVFMPKLIQRGMKVDADAVIDAFGKNEQVKKVIWTMFVAVAGLVLTRVVDPVTAQQIVGMITGIGCEMIAPPFILRRRCLGYEGADDEGK